MQPQKVFSIPVDVRFRDLDAMGHVNNAVYFTYFEEGRKNFSKHAFGLTDPSQFNFIMAHIRCDFVRPIKLADPVVLNMWVARIGTKSFAYTYRLLNPSAPEVVYASGESVQVYYDYQAEISLDIPEEVRAKLAEYAQNAS